MNKKILFLIILIIIVSLSLVSATENQTKDTHNIIQKTSKDSTTMIKTETKNTNKTKVNIKTNNVKGVIGENITLKASITDEKGKKVSGGNLVFKLNGKSLRTDKKFNSNAKALKIHVKNGTASVTITADAYLRNTKNLTASYSGTSQYEETQSNVTTVQIQKRRANIEVMADKTTSHAQVLTIIAILKDADSTYKNTTILHENTSVIFKINGKTINQNNVKYFKVNQDNIARCEYRIPYDMGAIDRNRKIINHTITAVLVSNNYYPDVKNTTNFIIQRSNLSFIYSDFRITYDNKLNVRGSLYEYGPLRLENFKIKDSPPFYSDFYVRGKSKFCLKINGKTFTDSEGKAKYWELEDGYMNISVNIPKNTVVKRIMFVFGERQAYLSHREELNLTTDLLGYLPYEHYYRYTKYDKKYHLCYNYYETIDMGDYRELKDFYHSFIESDKLFLALTIPEKMSVDMMKGNFSFFDEKGFIGNGKISKKYGYTVDYIIECPYKNDGKDHEFKIKYTHPNNHQLDQIYTITVNAVNSQRERSKEIYAIDTSYIKNYLSQCWAGEDYYIMEYLPNSIENFTVETTFSYDKVNILLNNKLHTFKNTDESDFVALPFNLTLPSKYGEYDMKFTFYDKNNNILLEKTVPIIIKNTLNDEGEVLRRSTLMPLNYTYTYNITTYTTDALNSLGIKYKTMHITFNNKTIYLPYPEENAVRTFNITTPNKPGNYTMTYTLYNENKQKMDTNKINIEVYKYSPLLFTKIDYANASRNYSYIEKELVVNQSIFKKGTKFNVSCSPSVKGRQLHMFDEKCMRRVVFKNLKNNQTFIKYSYDNEFEVPKITGDYELKIDFIGQDRYNDVNLIKSKVKII